MSNNNGNLIDRLEANSIRLKANEEIERLKFQLTQERAAHSQTRATLRDARDALKSECFDHIETERRKEREAALLRNMYNNAIVRWDAAGSCAGAATGIVSGFGFGAMVLAALDAGGLLGAPAFILAGVVSLLTGIVVRTKVYSSLVDEEGEE